MSGNVDLYTENFAENQIEHSTTISEQMDLNPDDFYKELRLRGYQYKDEFLGFVEGNGEGKIVESVLLVRHVYRICRIYSNL